MTKKIIPCRICGSSQILDLKIEKPFFLLNMNKSAALSYAVCRHCQFIFQRNYLGDRFMNKYYDTSLMFRRQEVTHREIKGYEKQADFLSRYRPLTGLKVLEVGADTGQFLMYLKVEFGCHVYFDELNFDARKILLKRKVIKDFRRHYRKVKMDVVVLRHILEHIFDLRGFLKYISTVLKEDGLLFIEVPDWSFFDEHTDHFIFEHINQFNAYNLVMLLKKSGFITEQIEKSIWKEYRSTPNRVLRVLARPSKLAKLDEAKIVNDVRDFDNKLMSVYRKIDVQLKRIPRNARIALCPGAGFTFEALLHTDLKKRDVVGIYDIDSRKHGKKIQGVRIFPREQLSLHRPDIILILTYGGFEQEIKEYIESLKIEPKIICWSEIEGRS